MFLPKIHDGKMKKANLHYLVDLPLHSTIPFFLFINKNFSFCCFGRESKGLRAQLPPGVPFFLVSNIV